MKIHISFIWIFICQVFFITSCDLQKDIESGAFDPYVAVTVDLSVYTFTGYDDYYPRVSDTVNIEIYRDNSTDVFQTFITNEENGYVGYTTGEMSLKKGKVMGVCAYVAYHINYDVVTMSLTYEDAKKSAKWENGQYTYTWQPTLYVRIPQ